MFARVTPSALALMLLAGCSGEPHGPRVRSGDPDVEVKSPTELTDDKLRQLADQIASAAQKQDAAALAAIFDWDAVIYAAASDIQAPVAEHKRFAAEMKGDGKQLGVLGEQIVQLVAKGATYKFLRSRVKEEQQRLLFRLAVPDDQGLNYHDVVLSRRPDGKIRASDIYIFANGEMLSQTTRRAFLMRTLRLAQVTAAKFQGVELAFQMHFKKVELMNELARTGRPNDALKLYDQLPPELQRDKNVLLSRLSAAQLVGGVPYDEAIEDFRTFQPNDPCVELFSITYYRDKHDFAAALSKVGVIEKAIGCDDPYLNVVRSSLQLEANKPVAARALAEKAVAAEPTLADAYWMLVNVSLHEKNHAETLDRLKEIARRFPPSPGDLTKLPKYAEFVKSPQYQEWLKSRKN